MSQTLTLPEETASALTARALYPLACDPECPVADSVPVARVREVVARAADVAPATDGLTSLREEARAWGGAERTRFTSLMEQLADEGARETAIRRTVLQCAPLGLVSGAWLQWSSSMATADDPVALASLVLYASDVGVGYPHESRGDAFAALLRRLRAAEHAPSARIALDQRIDDVGFSLPALLLLLGRLPGEFLPEVLGADLCLREVGLLPPLAVARSLTGPPADLVPLDPGSARSLDPAGGTGAAEAAVRTLLEQRPGDAGRIVAGFSWAYAELRDFTAHTYEVARSMCSPAWQAAELLRLRAREGAAYHQSFELAGRPLSAWLEEAQTNPQPLLAKLAESRLVKAGKPSRSPLVNGLVGENGAMFRVFTPEDLDVLRRWIASLPADGTKYAGSDSTDLAGARAPAQREPLGFTLVPSAARGDDRPPRDIREAYVLLQRRNQAPAVRTYAIEYVHGWLGRAAHCIDRSGIPLPAAWSEEGLRPWLADQHDHHATEFEQGDDSLPSREALIESTVQLAPLTMIDGAWLQGFTDHRLASSGVGFSLFETYWDELGNGQAALNHPLIYRELVAEMGVDLPPTGSSEFAQWSGFRDASFELPVYWLSIGRFPVTFQPEVLGLNLAMELSGVGGSYRRARLGLHKHGFSTRFVDIHNTIDNVATGHSAWAADAIDSLMSELPAHGTARAQAWRRIRTGYRSLNPPSGLAAKRAGRRARRSVREH